MLASTYRAMPSISALKTGDGKIEFRATPQAKVSLELALRDESPRTSIELVEGVARVGAFDPADSDSSHTVRWRYALRVSDGPIALDR